MAQQPIALWVLPLERRLSDQLTLLVAQLPGQQLKLIGKEIKERILFKAEERKIGTVYPVASELISKSLIVGKNCATTFLT